MTVTCPYCGGAGEVPEDSTRYVKCPECGGAGVVDDHGQTDVRALVASIETGARVVREVAPKILEVSAPGVASLFRVGKLIYDSSLVERRGGERSARRCS